MAVKHKTGVVQVGGGWQPTCACGWPDGPVVPERAHAEQIGAHHFMSNRTTAGLGRQLVWLIIISLAAGGLVLAAILSARGKL